jgi:type 1 glutamine amidotransferase
VTMGRCKWGRRGVLLALAAALFAGAWVGPPIAAQGARKRMLVVTHTAGFRHSSIPVAQETLQELGERTGLWETEFATNAEEVTQKITADNLRRFDVVVFANTTGELPISDAGKEAFMAWLRGGKAFVGMHSATDTLYKWPEYGKMIGGYFDGHPWSQKVTVKVEDTDHPATRHLGRSFEINDEIYQFRDWSQEGKHVLLSIDNNSIDVTKGKRADEDYAVSWVREEGQGRVFYTSLGHGEEVWRDPRYQQHLVGGIAWAMRVPAPELAAK